MPKQGFILHADRGLEIFDVEMDKLKFLDRLKSALLAPNYTDKNIMGRILEGDLSMFGDGGMLQMCPFSGKGVVVYLGTYGRS